jgi:hypothetical protein
VAYESAYVQNSATIPTLGELQAALSTNNSAKVDSAAGPGTWGYVATATGGTLTPSHRYACRLRLRRHHLELTAQI